MPLEGVKNIILILSGKGGVGKSSVTLQLALTLSLQGRSVGILDVDLTGPSIPRLVGLENAKIVQSSRGWVPVPVHDALPAEQIATSSAGGNNGDNSTISASSPSTTITTDPPSRRGSLRCMSLGFLLRDRGDAVIWRGPKKTAMVRQFLTDVYWGETDYLLVDTPPGTSDEHIALAEQLLTLATASSISISASTTGSIAGELPRLAGAVLVTTPQAVSISDVRKEINFCAKTQIPVLGVIENMSGYACPCCGVVTNIFSKDGGKVMAMDMGVPFLGSVPVDIKFGAMVTSKTTDDDGVQDGADDYDGDDDYGDDNGHDDINGDPETGADRGSRNAPTSSHDEWVTPPEEDDRLLVDRYRDCWSFPIFGSFAKSLIQTIEGTSGGMA